MFKAFFILYYYLALQKHAKKQIFPSSPILSADFL